MLSDCRVPGQAYAGRSYRQGLLLQNDGGRLEAVLIQLCPQPGVFCQQHGVQVQGQVLSCRPRGKAGGGERREGCRHGHRCLRAGLSCPHVPCLIRRSILLRSALPLFPSPQWLPAAAVLGSDLYNLTAVFSMSMPAICPGSILALHLSLFPLLCWAFCSLALCPP